ncbi:MAG: hypothetical protein ACLUJC_06755 [Clostridia bacterium]
MSTSFCDFYIKKRRAAWGQQDQRAAWERKSGARHGDSRTNARHGSEKAARSIGRAQQEAARATRSKGRKSGAQHGAKKRRAG